MAGEDLNSIISVFLDDQATGPLQEIPVAVAATVSEINAKLAGLAAENPFAKLLSDAERAHLTLEQVSAAIKGTADAYGLLAKAEHQLAASGNVSPGQRLSQLREQAAAGLITQGELLQEFKHVQEVAATRVSGVQGQLGISTQDLSAQLSLLKEMRAELAAVQQISTQGSPGLVAQEAELARLPAARILPRPPAARILPRPPEEVLAPYASASGFDVLAAQARIKSLQDQAASLKEQAGRPGTDDKAARAATSVAAAQLREATDLTTALNSVRAQEAVQARETASAEETLAKALQVVVGETAAIQRASAGSYLAQLNVDSAAATGNVEKTVAALRQQIAAQEQLAKAREQAAVAGAGGGGFFGGFGKGLIGGNGDFGDSANIGRQLGDIARYIYVYDAFYKITEAVKESIKLTKEYENGLVSLQVALQSVGQQGAVTAQQLVSVGATGGFTPGESLQVASRGIQAFRDESSTSAAAAQAVALQTVDAAQQGVVLSGQKVTEVQDQIIAATRAYDLGAAGQTRTLDAATNANISFGASIKDVLEGLAQVAGIGKESGFTIEQLANAIGLITSTTGLSGSSAAGDLKRILGGAGAPAFQKALEQVGVDTTNQTVEQQIVSLADKYQTLTRAQQENVLTTLGGRRSAESLIPLLESSGRFAEANAFSLSNAGAAAEQYAKRQDTLAGTLRQLGGLSKELLVDLGQSGVGAGFGLALQALLPLLRTLDEGLKLFNDIPAPIRNIAFALLEMAAAMKVVEALQLGSLVGRVGGALLGSRVGGVLLPGAAAATEVEAAAVAGGAAAPGIIGATLGVGKAAVGAALGTGEAGALTASLGGLAAAAGPAAIAIGVLTTAIAASKAITLAQDLGKVNDVIEQINQTITRSPGGDALQSAASQAGSEAAKLNKESSGLLGSISNALNAGAGSEQAKSLSAYAKFVSEQSSLLAASSAPTGGGEGFGPSGPQSVEQLDAKVKQLTESGHTSAQIVDLLSVSIQQLGTQAVAARGLLGGLTTGPSGGAGFASLAASAPPSSLPGGFEGVIEKLSNAPLALIFGDNRKQLDLATARREALKTQVSDFLGSEGKSAPNSRLDDVELGHIADLYAAQVVEQFHLSPDQAKKIRNEYLQKYLQKIAVTPANAAGGLDTGTLDEAVAQLIKAQQGALSDATARGASLSEILKIQQGFAVNLEAAIAAYPKFGSTADLGELKQKILVAGKDAFDAFQSRVLELANIAKADAGNDQALKAQIDTKTAAILAVANGVDPNLLPSAVTSLDDASGKLAGGATQTAANFAAKMAQYRRDLAAYELRLKSAEHLLDVENSLLGLGLGGASVTGGQLLDPLGLLGGSPSSPSPSGAKPTPPTKTKNDPSADAGIAALKAAGAGAAAAVTETAAQIAAAANAANVFPGAPVETAAAAVRTAAADLAAQKKHDVAYYNALKQLRQAQYDYAQAVLEAQHVARELSIDLTNPLAVAQEALRTAQAKLSSDRAKRAPSDVINNDRLAVEQAANAAEATKFSQDLDQVKTNYDLERITRTQYINYLDAQRDHLLAIHKRTYQQQQELNQIDTLLKEAAKQLQGQFNLGDIKLPTPFEVRRQIAGGASAAVGSTQYVNVNISGADTAKVTAVLTTLIGPSAFGRATVTTTKV